MIMLFIGGVVVLAALAFAGLASNDGAFITRGTKVITVIVSLVVFAGCWVIASVTQVPAKSIGVPTEFGKPMEDNLEPGLHFIKPWVNVTDIDGTLHFTEYRGDDCIDAKIADGGAACVSLTYRWRINTAGADDIYADFRNADDIEEEVRRAIVSTNVKSAVNEALQSYDPLADVALETDMSPADLLKTKINVAPDLDAIAADITAKTEENIAVLGGVVDIEQITVSYLRLPERTQDKIDAFNAAVQDVRLAIQDRAIKEAQAAANVELEESLTPEILASRCLDIVASGITLPTNFQCFGAGNTSVLLGSK